MDRHDGFPTEAQWDDYWEPRQLANFKVALTTTAELPKRHFRQTTSFDGQAVGVDPVITIRANEGAPYRWRRDPDLAEIELIHGEAAEPEGGLGTSVTWQPRQVGRAQLRAKLHPYEGERAYLQAQDVVYEIKHRDGVERLRLDQDDPLLDLGSYELTQDSTVTVYAEAGGNADRLVRVGPLLVEPDQGEPFEVGFKQLPDNILEVPGYGLGVVDFWQHWPIEASAADKELTVNAILDPAPWTGGIGLTLDLVIALDPAATKAGLAAATAPPARSLPASWSAFDGTLVPHADYDALVARAAAEIARNDQGDDNYGWRGYGDYQIGTSYAADGETVEDWGGLQYDLGSGLLVAWLRTGEPALWHRARAALRHQMDVGMAKFWPYAPKRSGHLYRKGECPTPNIITCDEPLPDFGFGYRGFLLWQHLTGEAWAGELARQEIDALAYFSARSGGTRRSQTDWLLGIGSRPAAWILRGLLAGDQHLPDGGTRYFAENGEDIDFPVGTPYRELLREQLDVLLPKIEEVGHFPSDQPVWSGQGLEALAMIHAARIDAAAEPALRRAVLASCDDLLASLRWSGLGYEFLYDREGGDAEWTEEQNYGWLWLSGIAYCADLQPSGAYAETADDLFDHLVSHYAGASEIATREWSAILAYPGYYLASLAQRSN